MRNLVTAGILSLALCTGTAIAAAGDPTGIWRMDDGKVTVRVSHCGGKLCGTLVALKKPLNKAGQPKTDKENPNPALRGRKLIGLTVFSNLRPDGEGKWVGSIYNPDDGRIYSGSLKLKGDRIKVAACVVGILCQTNSFSRSN